MLPRADLNASRPLTAVEAPTPVQTGDDARQEVFQRLSRLALGRELLASVLSRFDDGTFLVKIADVNARVALPVGARVGDSLPMTLVAKEPRPTFLLARTPDPGGADSASVSPAGRLIDQVLRAAGRDGAPAAVMARGALVAQPPLTATAAPDPGRMAAQLQVEVDASGVFYESHLQEWISGSRPLQTLLREPQAALGAQAAPAPNAPAGPPPASAPADAPAPLPIPLPQRTQAPPEGRDVDARVLARVQSGDDPQTARPATTPDPQPLEPAAARMVNLQLHALEHQQLRWQGELWPGQPMQWEVTRDAPQRERRDGADAPEPGWTSVVRFELPTLGAIEATVRLSGGRVEVRMHAGADAAAALRAHGAALADALQGAGSPLERFTVQTDEAP